jgi:hypothetical protein
VDTQHLEGDKLPLIYSRALFQVPPLGGEGRSVTRIAASCPVHPLPWNSLGPRNGQMGKL